ncbi:MAG: DMT family transporter, partial [Pseudomonadota bacterium]
MLTTHAKGLLITACGVLVISPDGLLTRLIQTDHWTMIFWRALFLAFGMWLVVSFRHPNRVWRQYQTLRGVGIYLVVGYSMGTVSFIYALTHTSVANTLIIMSTTPLFAALIGWVFLREKIGLRTLVAILLVGCGITVIAIGSGTGSGETSLIGDLVALAGSFFLAFGFSFVRRFPPVSSCSAISCSGLLTALLIVP